MRRYSCLVILAACNGGGGDCITDEAFFADTIAPILESDCAVCHVADGPAGETRHVLIPGDDAANFATLAALASEREDGLPLLLAKPANVNGHGGGTRFVRGDDGWAAFEELVARYETPGQCADPGLAPTCEPGRVAPGAVPLRRMSDRQYRNSVIDLLGFDPAPGLFPSTDMGEFYGTWTVANGMSATGAEGAMLAAEDVAARATSDVDALMGCDAGNDACSSAWIAAFAEAAYRRPLVGDELQILEGGFDAGADPAEGARIAIEIVLQSPQFLYLDVTGAGLVEGETDIAHLTDYAIATRLSYFLLDSPPPADLLAAAAAGQLHTRDQIREWAWTLVDDPRVLPVIAGFHRDWARLWQLDGMSKDPELYPEWGPDLMDQMVTELDLFTTEVVWLGDGTFDALLYSDVTWTTADLDAIYGIGQERVAEWQRTTLDPWERPGVLSRTAFLTSHGYSATPAPVRRGAFVVKQMLCQDLVPPANVDMNLPEPSEGETIRDRLAAHRADPACAGCHEKIDPVGFSMEHYGAIGEWRDAYHDGLAIDATGSLIDPAGEFDGLSELLGVVDAELDARDCYAEQWFEYAVGRAVMETDFCGLAQVQDRFALADGDLRELLVAVTQTDAFLYRPVVEVE